MNVTFRKIDYSQNIDCEILAKWRNDRFLQKLWIPRKINNDTFVPQVTVDQIRSEEQQRSRFSPVLEEFAVLGDRIVGQISIIIDPPHKKTLHASVAWPSIIIGESSIRGTGIVRKFGDRIITVSRSLGVSYIEAGVFEFNKTIRRILEGAGFEEFSRVECMTYIEGKPAADIRYRLQL